MTHRYRVIAHTADTGIETRGGTLTEAIGNAAYAMFDLMYGLSSVTSNMKITFESTAESPPDMLVDVLSELLLRSETMGVVFAEFRIHEAEAGATVEAAGAPAGDLELRGPPIKAVTYHRLRVRQARAGWEIRVIFDV